jgi:hypothetical protein
MHPKNLENPFLDFAKNLSKLLNYHLTYFIHSIRSLMARIKIENLYLRLLIIVKTSKPIYLPELNPTEPDICLVTLFRSNKTNLM